MLLLFFLSGYIKDKKKGGGAVANYDAPLRLPLNARITTAHHKKLNDILDRLQEEEDRKRTFKKVTKYNAIEKIIDHAYINMITRQ